MKSKLSILVIGLGVTIIFGGFVYDVMFAGIPYQDPTPAMLARYNFHAQIASMIRWSGAGLCIFGCVTIIARRFMKKVAAGS